MKCICFHLDAWRALMLLLPPIYPNFLFPAEGAEPPG